MNFKPCGLFTLSAANTKTKLYHGSQVVLKMTNMDPFAVADPGFHRGGANPKGCVNLLFANFSQKLHENEEISGQKGGSLAPP